MEAELPEDDHRWIVWVSYIVLTYVVALRGNEGLMMELRGLKNQVKVGRQDHCMIVLFGKLKGEEHFREHPIPCINVTKSGINGRYTIRRLVQSKEALGLTSGPAISDSKGFLLPSREIDTMFHDLLTELFGIDSNLFPPTVTSTEEVIENYRVNRTLRRTVITRALEKKVGEEDINLVSKWKQRGVGKKN